MKGLMPNSDIKKTINLYKNYSSDSPGLRGGVNGKIFWEQAFVFFRQNEILTENLQTFQKLQELPNSPCGFLGFF